METLIQILAIVVCIGLFMLPIIAQWIIFEKAGKPGWASIIPIYGIYVLLKIVGKPGWWLLLFCIPVVNVVYFIWMLNMLSKSFGKTDEFTLGLLFLSFIFLPILAFGDAAYLGPFGDPAAFQRATTPELDMDVRP